MSSFLCFICHSTVNKDTNEETRDKYKEVIGIMLCPDSHLCFICCHVLRKLCLFKSICLKRSLEYPVLFSEKGTLNLQRSDVEFNIVCNEDMCLQQQLRKSNVKSYLYNNISAYDYFQENQSNQYVELEEERHDFVDYICQSGNNVKGFFLDNVLDQNKSYTDESGLLYDDISQRVQGYTYYNEAYERNEWSFPNDTRKLQTDCEYSIYNLGNVDYNASCQVNSLKPLEPVILDCTENLIVTEPIPKNPVLNVEPVIQKCNNNFIQDEPLSKDQVINDDLIPKCDNSFINNEPSPKSQDLEVVIYKNIVKKTIGNGLDKFNNEDIIHIHENKEVQTEHSNYESTCDESYSMETEVNSEHMSETDTQDDKHSDVVENDLDVNLETVEYNGIPKKKKKKKSNLLTVEEQKAELDARRKEKKYIEAEFKCHNCALGFLYKDSYQTHMMRHEESNGEHQCEVCTLRFACRRLLKAHCSVHARTVRVSSTPHAPAPCHRCGRVFMNPNRLRQHVKRSHLSKTANKSYPCSVCGKNFNNQAAVRTHMIKHIKGKFKCEKCPAIFSSPYTLNQHKKKHDIQPFEEPSHYCTLCNVTFSTRKSLLAHQRNTSKHQETVFECPVCKRTCATLSSLTSHMQSIHAGQKSHACDHCAASYTTRKSLLWHVRETHRGGAKRPDLCVCHLCGNSFKGSSKLARHLKKVCKKVTKEDFTPLYHQDQL